MENTSFGNHTDTNKDRILIEISEDCMNAYITFNVTENDLDLGNREQLIRDTAVKLREKGIIFGIKSGLFIQKLQAGIKYIIAEGTLPEDGKDSVIRMLELEEVKPEAIESEKVDYYNLSLIKIVEANTWLGERTPETKGFDGMNVKGEAVKAKNGIKFPLYYDKKVIDEVEENGKTVLYSKIYGAVYYKGNEISLMNPLVINEDVGVKTGNIVFDGCVIINGTICDGFFVEATNDIEVKGEMGLGNIKGIVSKKGSIYIKGGVHSKNRVNIEAEKNVYLKFIENVTVNCGGAAHIGFYCSNSDVNAREVIIDSAKGKIIGGNIKAVTRVFAGEIGSELEKKTSVEITCFDRASIKNEVDKVDRRIKDLTVEHEKARSRTSFYSDLPTLTAVQDRILYETNQRLEEIRGEMHALNEEKDLLASYLKARGDGEVKVTKKLHANTIITMKDKQIMINSLCYASDIVFQEGRILQL